MKEKGVYLFFFSIAVGIFLITLLIFFFVPLLFSSQERRKISVCSSTSAFYYTDECKPFSPLGEKNSPSGVSPPTEVYLEIEECDPSIDGVKYLKTTEKPPLKLKLYFSEQRDVPLRCGAKVLYQEDKVFSQSSFLFWMCVFLSVCIFFISGVCIFLIFYQKILTLGEKIFHRF